MNACLYLLLGSHLGSGRQFSMNLVPSTFTSLKPVLDASFSPAIKISI